MESANWKKQKVQLRRGTAAEWTARNTLLLPAEPGYETDTGRLKLGDGLTRWNSLAYWGAAEVSSGDYGQVIVNADGTWSVDITPADIGASAVGHTHSASEIVSGTLSDSRLSGNVVLTADARLSDAREWSAGTITQADAEAGVSTARQAFTALRVFQAIAAWWAGSAAKTKLDGIAAGATANSTDAQLRDRSTHTGSQAISTVSGLQAALDGKQASGSYATTADVALRAPIASPAFTGVVTLPSGGEAAPGTVLSATDTDTGLYHGGENTLAIACGGVRRFSISGVGLFVASNAIICGATTSRSAGPTTHPRVQLEGANAGNASLQCIAGSTTADASPQVILARHRGAIGESTVVASGDSLGLIRFNGGDGTDCVSTGAAIEARVDGTPGSNDMPGRLMFSTTADGSDAPAERMRIDSSGNVGIGTTAPSAMLDVNSSKVRVRSSHTPASASATGNAGDVCWDANYLYVCTATNTWRRIAHATW